MRGWGLLAKGLIMKVLKFIDLVFFSLASCAVAIMAGCDDMGDSSTTAGFPSEVTSGGTGGENVLYQPCGLGGLCDLNVADGCMELRNILGEVVKDQCSLICSKDSDCPSPGKCIHMEEANSCAIPCGPDNGCPSGYSCSADICWPEP